MKILCKDINNIRSLSEKLTEVMLKLVLMLTPWKQDINVILRARSQALADDPTFAEELSFF